MNPSDIAISVKNVSKTFKIPHEKVSSIRIAFTAGAKHLLSRRGAPRGCPPDHSSNGESNNYKGEGNHEGLPLQNQGGYEEFHALDNVSFEMKKGEFFGIIGRNGSGKSMVFKIFFERCCSKFFL